MAIPVVYDARDLARGIVVTPAWYRVRIDDVTKKRSSKGDSDNYQMEGTVICNADDNSTDFAGAIVTWNFNSKAMGFTQGLFKALLNTDKLIVGEEYDLDATKGKEVDIFIENGEWNGTIVNRINHKYRALKVA